MDDACLVIDPRRPGVLEDTSLACAHSEASVRKFRLYAPGRYNQVLSRVARYARAQLVKGLRTRFCRVAATRARTPRLQFIARNWILADPLNAYSHC